MCGISSVIAMSFYGRFALFCSSHKSEGLSITEEIEEDISIGSFAGSKVGIVAYLQRM